MPNMPDLEILLRNGNAYDPLSRPARDEQWLRCVRRLGCIRCRRSPAGTVHHVYSGGGTGTKCSDYLVVPACMDCHLIGKEPLQGMTPERFTEVVGLTIEDAVRRIHLLVGENVEQGIFDWRLK